jgi:hypothetical protein
MKQIYKPFWRWEDFLNGMYETVCNDEIDQQGEAIKLLSNCELFYTVGLEMISKWIIASQVNLTNNRINRKAWIGQAACNYKFGVIEIQTKIAWGLLTENQRIEANKVADQLIKLYEKKDKAIFGSLAQTLLF